MRKVEELKVGWQQELEARSAAAASKKIRSGKDAPDVEDEDKNASSDGEQKNAVATSLFDDDSDDDDGNVPSSNDRMVADLASRQQGDSQSYYHSIGATEKDLFGDSSDESDEELLPSGDKRDNGNLDDHQPLKKRRVE